MNKRLNLVDTAPIPGGGELRLFEDGEHFSIKIAGGGDLMSTRMHGSEDALARIACEGIASMKNPCVLIGGLGMGFTLAAALGQLADTASIVVAELVPGVIEWNRGPLGRHANFPILDSRVSVRECDVAELIGAGRLAYDAILLDVDNGPDGLTREENDSLYSMRGLAAAHAALRPKGVLAVWSAHSDRKFTERLRGCGFGVEEIPVRAHGNKGARHLIWLATRDDGVKASTTSKVSSQKRRVRNRR